MLANALVFYFMPTFPKEIWAALDALFAVVIGIMATKDSRAVVKERRLAEEQKSKTPVG